MDGKTDSWIDRRADIWSYRKMDKRLTERWMGRQTDGLTENGWAYGQMEKDIQKDGQTNGHMN